MMSVPAKAILITAIATAMSAMAQTPTAFDGQYAGTRTETRAGGKGQKVFCPTGTEVRMTIRGGIATVMSAGAQGNDIHFRGTVGAAGEISATANIPNGRLYSVTGAIQGGAFAGQMTINGRCYYNLTMART